MQVRRNLFGRLGLLFSLLALVQLTCPLLPGFTAETASLLPEQFLLPNGLKVLVLEEHCLPVVSTLVWYRVGARNETLGSTGVSHLVEHLLFRRVGNLRPGELSAQIARVGGQFNGYTSDDFTTFFEVLPPAKLELGLQIEADRMRSATFTEKDVQDEVANIHREFERENKDPIQSLTREIRAAAYQQHPYHNPTMGWQGDVERLTAAQAKQFYEHHFRPDNATLVIVGDVKTATVTALVKKHFGTIAKPASKLATQNSVEPPQRGERRVSLKSPGKQDICAIAYHAPAIHENDAPALTVIEKLLNAANTGRLRSKQPEPRVYLTASARFEAKKDPGLFEITLVVAPGNGEQKVLEGVESVINQLKEQAIPEAELRRARNLAEFAYFSERDGPYRTGFHLGYFDSLVGWQNAYTWPERLRAVTAADIQRAAKRTFNHDNRVVGWVSAANSPKVAPPKPESQADPSPAAEPKKGPHAKPADHVRMTGYKTDDYALGPEKHPAALIADKEQAASSSKASKARKEGAEGVGLSSDKKTADKAGVSSSPKKGSGKVDAGQASAAKKEPEKGASGQTSAAKKEPEKGASGQTSASRKTTDGSSAAQPVQGKVSPDGAAPAQSPVTKKPPDGQSTVSKVQQAGTGDKKPQLSNPSEKSAKSTTNVESGGHQASSSPSLPALPRIHSEGGFRTAHQRVLSNGATLVVLESHLSPVVQIVGAIKSGEVFDPPGKKGISAVTAAALNYGSTKRNRMQLMSQQEDIGLPPAAMLRFEAGQETIVFRSKCLSRDLGNQLAVVGEILTTPGFQEIDVDRAKQDVIGLMRRQQDEVESKVNRALLRSVVSSSSPYCPGDPVDRLKSIGKLAPEDLKDFQEHFLTPGSACVVIAGDVTLNQAAVAAEKALSAWTGKGVRQLPPVQASSKRVLRTSVPLKEKSGTMLCFGQLVPLSRNHQDYAAFLLADCALTNHPIFSRLGQLVNNEPQMANAVGSDALESDVEAISNAVEWSLTFSPEPNAVPYVVRTVQNELKNFTKNGLTPVELGEVKRYLLGAIPVRSMSTIESAADNVLESILQGGEPDFLAFILSGIKSATAESVNKLIRTTFRPDLASLVIAGSDQSITAVRNQAEKQSTSSSGAPAGGPKQSGKD